MVNSNTKVISSGKLIAYLILSLGVYYIYWFYKNNKHLKNELGEDISPGFRTLALIFIPIANIIVFYKLLDDMSRHIKEAGLESYSPLLNTVIFYFLGFTIIAPFWVLVHVQNSINKMWEKREQTSPDHPI